ncbi:MAG: tetratricopeptide repeat protein [Chitinivibrionales bacterium]|nr:tetratricopeptide repeat protein [Chitinivibrionales bacterium]
MRKSVIVCFLVCGCLFSAFMVNCAYLNLFYNAQAAYNKAHRSHLQLMKIHGDTAARLPDEITKGYDRTILKCQKVITDFPKEKGWHDDALFLQAKATYYNRLYEDAVRRFQSFLKEYPQSPFIPQAYEYLGRSYLDNGQLRDAEETFSYILLQYPQLNKNEEVTLLMAQVSIKREGKSQAIAILEKSLETVQTDVKKLQITLQLCNLYQELKLYDKTIPYLLKAPRPKGYPEELFEIDFLLLLSYKNLAQNEKAEELVDRMLAHKQYITHTAQLLVEKGIIYLQLHKSAEAEKMFLQVTSTKNSPAPLQGMAWFQLAQLYQHTHHNFSKAKQYYQKAFGLLVDEKLRRLSQERIKGIELTTVLADSVTKNSADTSGKRMNYYYKLGEVYWLNLQEPDSALKQFTTIASDRTADSASVMKSLYAQAWIHRFIKRDTLTSDSLYRKIIQRYPSSLVAQKSQRDIGQVVTVETRQDSAKRAFIEAERLYFEEHDPVAAVNAYYRVSKKYRDIADVAAESIYAAAWICDVVLSKNQKAFELYKMLCDSFPTSALCVNAAILKVKVVEDTLKIINNLEKAASVKPSSKQSKGSSAEKQKQPQAVQPSSQNPDSFLNPQDTLKSSDTVRSKYP